MSSPDQPGQALADGELNAGEVGRRLVSRDIDPDGHVVAVVVPSACLSHVEVDRRAANAGEEDPAEVVIRCSLAAARAVAVLMFHGRVRVEISLVEILEPSKAETLPAPPEAP